MSAKAADFSSIAPRRAATAGKSRSLISSAAATCITVGNTSFDDCDRFTSSFGWMGFLDPITPPASSIARLEMTSFAFMFDCVPLPVCHTTSGKCASSLPAITSSAARTMRSHLALSSLPRSWLASAAAFLTMPKARITGRPKRWPPILKFCRLRCVCAPQYLSAATSTWPMLSVSMRTWLMAGQASSMSRHRERERGQGGLVVPARRDGDRSPVELDDGPGDREVGAEAVPRSTRARQVVEDPAQPIGGDARPGIRDLDVDRVGLDPGRHRDAAPLGGRPERVVEQVTE